MHNDLGCRVDATDIVSKCLGLADTNLIHPVALRRDVRRVHLVKINESQLADTKASQVADETG